MATKKISLKEKQELLKKLKNFKGKPSKSVESKKFEDKKPDTSEGKKTLLDKIEFSSKPDFGVSRPSDVPLEEITTKRAANTQGRRLEEEAQEGMMHDDRKDRITYGANTDLYGRKKGEDKYIADNSLEKDISRDFVINDSIRREVNFDSERFNGYKTTSNAPEGVEQHIRRLENPHMEDFINKNIDNKYNSTKVIDILSQDKKEAESKYKKGGVR